jgi:Plasmid recombination enzyme.
MSKNLAVLRVEPVHATDLGAMGAHHDRSVESDSHIDVSRSHLNMQLMGTGQTRLDALNVIQGVKAAKSGGPVAAEGILTAGVDYFDEHYSGWREDSSVLQTWIDANVNFLQSGKVGTVTSAVLHLDEVAPHIHFVSIPISEVRLKNRYGERTENKISYGAIFADSKKHLAECRKAGTTSTDTKLGRLQTEYARAVASVGLRRGVSSKKKHETPKQYRDRIAAAEQAVPIQPITQRLVEPPVLSVTDKLDVMTRGVGAKVMQVQQEKLVAVANEAVSRGELARSAAALVIQNVQLKEQVQVLTESLKEKDSIMQQQADSLKRNSDKMQLIRALEPKQLMQLMNYSKEQLDPIVSGGKKWNAINTVMTIESIDFKSATQALLIATGNAEAVADSAAEHTREEVIASIPKENNIITPSVKKSAVHGRQEKEVIRELEAISAEKYRITLMHNDRSKPTINLGKNRVEGEPERFYTATEVLELLPTLAYRNAQSYNVFITPIPTDAEHFILIDDIRNLEAVKEYQPSLILQSSPKSQQALLKVNGNFSNEQLNAYFKQLNEEHGDPKISAVIHPLRLAGFTNRKPKYKDSRGYFPFVSIVESMGGYSEKATSELSKFTLDIVQTVKEKCKFIDTVNINISSKPEIDDGLKRYAIQFYAIAARNGEQDLSKTDYALCRKLLENGKPQHEIACVLEACSPAIHGRHKGQVDGYISRTIEAATKNENAARLKIK